MAHGLTSKDAMFSANGITPWHQLGVVLEGVPTEEEAIKLANFDFTVGVRPLYIPSGDGFNVTHVPSQVGQAVVRNEDGHVYAIVGGRFTLALQPADTIRWFRTSFGDLVTLETAGTLLDRTRCFASGQVKDHDLRAEIVKGDEVRRYVMLAHGYASDFSYFAGPTDIRPVCKNTVGAAISEGSMFKIRHTKSAAIRLENVGKTLAKFIEAFHKNVEAWRHLAKVRFTEEEAKTYISEIFPKPKKTKADVYAPPAGVALLDDLLGAKAEAAEKEADECDEIIDRVWNEVMELHESGMGADIPGVRGSYWGLYNAAVEYKQYVQGRGDAGLTDKRLAAVAFGSTWNQMAVQKALDFAKYGS